MKTCAYCGSGLDTNYCSFCELELTSRYILEDGKRLQNSIEFYPEKQGIFKNTPELLRLETIELLCLLREAREYRSDVYKLRILAHKGKAQAAERSKDMKSMNSIDVMSYSDYEDATRKVWVLENIIKDRIGYFPKKVTEQFLSLYLHRIEQSQTKKMIIKKAV
jgi:hypothetical protein